MEATGQLFIHGQEWHPHLERPIQVDPLSVECACDVIDRVLDGVVLSDEIDKSVWALLVLSCWTTEPDLLIVHNADPAYDLIHARLATRLNLLDTRLARPHDLAHPLADARAHTTHRLKPGHLVPDGRLARAHVGAHALKLPRHAREVLHEWVEACVEMRVDERVQVEGRGRKRSSGRRT